jgi:hypothetical protein
VAALGTIRKFAPLITVTLRFEERDTARFAARRELASLTVSVMIRKLKSGEYRLYSRKINPKTGRRRNLGTFKTRAAAEKHERAVQFFKRAG